MNAIDAQFARLRAAGRKAFMPFVTAGDPSLDFTRRFLPRLADAGADLLEIGFPFSDPIADGPVIQASYTRALDRGLKLDELFHDLGRMLRRPEWKVPAVAMASFSLIWRRGPEKFVEQAAAAGLSGVIVPDLPVEEADAFARIAAARDFKLILLWTPTTSPARAERILRCCTGFVYCVSVVGITGERDRLPESLRGQLRTLRSMTDLPLCVGFGVSQPDQVRELREFADGVIVGSAIVKHLEMAAANPDEAIEAVAGLVRELSAAVNPS